MVDKSKLAAASCWEASLENYEGNHKEHPLFSPMLESYMLSQGLTA